ncbi:fimbrial protein [Pantoea ananatis]|nr:fimbrial protein [Pantoea ananatis]PWV83879.1 fimbrial protein [Pantoea ananatis]REC89179.1 fimbrial protein [Pantoea ananatis]
MLVQSVNKALNMKNHAAVFSLLMLTFFTSSVFGKCTPQSNIGTPGDDRSGGVPLIFGSIKLQPTEFMPTGLIGVTHVSVGLAQAFQTRQGPDTLLYTCDLADEGQTYEVFATNGDSNVGGNISAGDGVYQTYFPYIGIRLIRDADGKVFSRYWQSSPIHGHREGNKLKFYARDFSSVTAEIYRLPATLRDGDPVAHWGCSGPADDIATGIGYTCPQPNAYTVFVGPGWNDNRNIKPGTDSNTNWGGFSNKNWIGFGMQYSSANTFMQTLWGCRVLSYTNPVILPKVTLRELASGFEDKGINFDVTYRCGGPLVNSLFINKKAGVGPDKVSVAFVTTNPLLGSGKWSRYTLSDNYGQNGYASNVGIGVSVNGKAVGFITNAYTDDYTSGWFSLVDGEVSRSNNSSSQVDIKSQYFAYYGVIDPSKPVTPGKVDSTAYIVVRYW